MTKRTMIERVARAICEKSTGHPPDTKASLIYKWADGKLWESYVPQARAAIEAMREPTPGMVEAGDDCEGPPGYGRFGPKWAEDVWPTMIDAALKENQK